MKRENYHIVIATGGSGGHIIPAETLALKLKNLSCDVEILGHKVASNLFFSNHELKKISVTSAPLNLKKLPQFFYQVTKGTFEAIRRFKNTRPDCVVGFGSYHSFPVLLAALLLDIPIALYEANATMGKVIKLFSKRAKLIGSPFDFYRNLAAFIQVKPLIRSAGTSVTKQEAISHYGFDVNKKVVLVLGGSQGAHFLNTKGLEAFCKALDPNIWQVLHLAGQKSDTRAIHNSYSHHQIHALVIPYESNMPRAYVASDLVISRSGATTLFELAEFQKPALLVPFPQAADDHQLLNADHYVKHYQAAMLEEQLVGELCIKDLLDRLMQNPKETRTESYFVNHTHFEKKVLDLCSKT